MADFNDVAVVENNEVVDVEPVNGEVVNTEDTYDEGGKVTVKDAVVGATFGVVLVVGIIETTKKTIKAAKWLGGKAVEGVGKLKTKFGKKKEAEVTEDVTEVTTEEVKAE